MSTSRHSIQRNNPRWNAPDVTLEKARNEMWTASIKGEGKPAFYLHSRYDPITEAERFAASQLRSLVEEKPDRIVLYGTGCGHHVTALLKQTEAAGISVEVWETNVEAFLQIEQTGTGAFAELLDNTRLTLVVSDDLQIFSERVKDWQGSRIHVIVHEPSLRAMPMELESLKGVLRDYQIKHNSVIIHSELLHDNFIRNNRKVWPSVSAFQGLLHSIPAILISAGPSLAKTLPLLPSAAKHCLLGSVGTSASLLFRHGIRPDFVVMTDPQQGMLRQLDGWETAEIPLFFLSTLYSEVVEQYQGPKFILFQEGFIPAENMASLRGEPLVQTGGSVSTTLFSLARILGMRPLCLVGQDLAYSDNQSHAEGTPLHQSWEQQAKGERVLAFDRKGTVVSPHNLLLYKKWFEEKARNSSDVFYNASEGGAYIDGFDHVTLLEFLTNLQGNDVTEAREAFRRLARSASMN